jgi:hypothetical protein
MSAADDSEPVLAMIRAAGLAGYVQGEQKETTPATRAPNDEAEDILSVVRAVGLAGYVNGEQGSTTPATLGIA